MGMRQPEPVPGALQRLLRTLDIEKKVLAHAVEPAWPRAVGARLAPHTRASRLLGGVLTVEARSAAWLNEVSLLRETILEQLHRELPQATVRELRFRLGGAFPPIESAPSRSVQVSEAEIAETRRQL